MTATLQEKMLGHHRHSGTVVKKMGSHNHAPVKKMGSYNAPVRRLGFYNGTGASTGNAYNEMYPRY